MFIKLHFFLVVLLVVCVYAVQSERISEKKCREIYSTITSTPPSSQTNPGEDLGFGKVSTVPGEFPYMVALGWKNEEGDGYDFYCGGSLISPEYVLSVAHCTRSSRGNPLVVRIGGGSLLNTSIENVGIVESIVHPEYNHNKFYNDIALLKLASPSSQTPVCLWQSAEIKQSEVTAIGYGIIRFEGSQSSDLLKVNLDTVPNDDCRTQFEPMKRLEEGIIDSQVCVGDASKKKDTCKGDTGGPLLVKVRDNSKEIPYVVGIISFGRSCATGTPTVSTRVSSYLDWIESVVWP